MKKLFVLGGAVAVLFSACHTGGGNMKSIEDSLAYAMGLDMGNYIHNMDSALEVNLNVDLVVKGMKAGMKSDTTVMSKTAAQAVGQRFFMIIKPQRDSAASAAFLAAVEKDSSNVKKTPSGLLYRIISEGDKSVKADTTNKVRVMYRMTDRKYNDIQNTFKTNDTVSIPMANGAAIQGWLEGLKLIGKGGQIELWIPSALGYGAHGNQFGGIPANAALYYKVQLIDVQPKDAPVAPAAPATPAAKPMKK